MCVCASVGWVGPTIRRRFGSLEVWKRFGTGLCRSPRCIDLDALCVCVYSHRQYVPVPMHKQSRAALSNKQVQADEQTSSTEEGRLWILWCKDSRAPTQTTIVAGPSQGLIHVRLDRVEWGGVDGRPLVDRNVLHGTPAGSCPSEPSLNPSNGRINHPAHAPLFGPFQPTNSQEARSLSIPLFKSTGRRTQGAARSQQVVIAALGPPAEERGSVDPVTPSPSSPARCCRVHPSVHPSQLPPLDTRPPCCTTTSG